MQLRRLRTRFLLASATLVLTTLGCGVWSALTFAHLSRAVDETLETSQATIDLSARLSGMLEREDDSLLVALGGDVAGARRALSQQRQEFDDVYAALGRVLTDSDERDASAELRRHVDAYRTAGDTLLEAAGAADARGRYQTDVNPLLRKAVGDAARVREVNLRSMQLAGIRARDEAERAITVVAIVSLGALAITLVIAVYLSRTVEKPIREMTASVEALRRGEFERRVELTTGDEIAQLGAGFNRMAEALAEVRRSNLAEVLRTKAALEATLAALPDAVIVLGADGRILNCNEPAREFMKSMSCANATKLEDLALTEEALERTRRAMRGGPQESLRADLRRSIVVTLAGGPRRLMPIAVPIRELAPGEDGAILMLSDVTDFARLDELRTELVGVASHELRTPLTTIRMNLLLLEERASALDPRTRALVETALGGCDQLAGTVDELLDLTRIEAGQLRLDLQRLDVSSWVAHAVAGERERFADAGVTLREAIGEDGVLIRADPGRLRIVLANVLGNALKYTPRGGEVAVEVSSLRSTAGGEAWIVRIAVTDAGPGVPEELHERIFEKFFRVEHEHPEHAAATKGAGIGLYVARQIVEAHGGRIRCEAGPGGAGAQFVIELPAETPAHSIATAS